MKKSVNIEEETARSMYKTASPECKVALEETFGKEFFSGKITNRIKTYEDACQELGIEPVNEKEMLRSGSTIDEIAYKQLKTIIKALNEGWIPNWKDTNEYKYYPYFNMSVASGFGFSASVYCCDLSYSYVGSRLSFKNRELSNYAGKQFETLYEDFMK